MNMAKRLLVLVATGTFAINGWAAEPKRASNKEMAGFGSGAVIGAAAGGPVGLVLGAALGVWLGERFQHEQDEREALALRYEQAQADIASLQGTVLRSEEAVARLESQLLSQQRAHRMSIQEAIDVQVLFRTGEDALDEDAEARLARVGRLIAPMEGLEVRLVGHTDGRGDEEFNLELSERRAEAVRDVLIGAGVPAERIAARGEGKRYATADPGDIDAMAMERRVHIQLVSERDGPRVARY